jgi:hypothetical protein
VATHGALKNVSSFRQRQAGETDITPPEPADGTDATTGTEVA